MYPLLLSIFFSVPADTTLPAPVELESITITAAANDPNKHITGSAVVLSQKELRLFEQSDANTILQNQPGVYAQQEDGWGLRMNVGIRGTGTLRSSRITLMEDGILTAPAAYSAPEAYYTPVIWKYEQIEVLKGAAQIITGPQSTGGALNFITPTQEGDGQEILLGGGTFGQQKAYWRGQKAWGKKTQIQYGAYHHSADGFGQLLNSTTGGFKLQDGYFKIVHHLDDKDRHHLHWLTAATREHSQQTYLGTTFDHALSQPSLRYLASANDQMDMDRLMNRLGYTLNFNQGFFRADLYRQYVHRNWYKLDKVNGQGIANVLQQPTDYPVEFLAIQGLHTDTALATLKANNRYYISQGIQLRGQWSQRLERNILKHEAGLRFHYDHADRFQHSDSYSIVGAQMALQNRGAEGAAGNRIDATSAASGYYRTTWTRGSWKVQAGGRSELIFASREDFGAADPERTGINASARANRTLVFLPGMSINKQTEQWNIFAGIHRGFTPAGSKEGVLPELSISTEFGLEHTQRPLQLVAFHSAYDRLLGSDAASAGGSGSGELYNGGSAQISGVEGQFSHQFHRHQFTFTGTWTRAVFTESFSSEFEGWGNVEKGDVLPYLPLGQASLRYDVALKPINFSLQSQLLGARKSSASLDQWDLPAALVINAAASIPVRPSTTLKLSAQNLTNTRHVVAARPAGYRTFAPRMLLLTLQAKF